MADSHPENTDSLSRMDPHAEFDPLFRLERNRTSTHNAISYAVAVPAITFLVAFVIAMISRTMGGPLCNAGVSTWICSRTFEGALRTMASLASNIMGARTLHAAVDDELWHDAHYWSPLDTGIVLA